MCSRFLAIITFLLSVACPVSAHVTPTQTLFQINTELEQDPDNTSLLLDKAHILQRENRLEESREILERVDTLESPRSSDSVYLWVAQLMRERSYEEALKISDRGIVAFPENFYQWQVRAQVLMLMKQMDEAVAAYERSLDFDTSGSQRGYVFIARLLLGRNEPGDKEHAVALLNRAIEKLGNLSELHHMCLRLETELERYDAALSHVEKLEERFGEQISFALKRAEILEKAERPEAAVNAYQSALTLLNASKEAQHGGARYIERKERIESSITRLSAQVEG